jgi:hypothetical protein
MKIFNKSTEILVDGADKDVLPCHLHSFQNTNQKENHYSPSHRRDFARRYRLAYTGRKAFASRYRLAYIGPNAPLAHLFFSFGKLAHFHFLVRQEQDYIGKSNFYGFISLKSKKSNRIQTEKNRDNPEKTVLNSFLF